MRTVAPNLMEVSATASVHKENGVAANPPKELDAGALFVLKSQGSWLHCGYHLTTSIVAPALLSLPFALTLLGWVGGLICLALAGLVTFYSYNLLSLCLGLLKNKPGQLTCDWRLSSAGFLQGHSLMELSAGFWKAWFGDYSWALQGLCARGLMDGAQGNFGRAMLEYGRWLWASELLPEFFGLKVLRGWVLLASGIEAKRIKIS